ncbi:MAG: P1 family peptidase, partial [Candidatus Marinimicrobia bacterium]|nr:P1 family peptidase [Candidatus Neomarinimicrobiota bacterium]
AFSTNEDLRVPYQIDSDYLINQKELRNSSMTPLFEAVIEATEEAVLNSLFQAETMTGKDRVTIEALPVNKTINILKKYSVIK